MINRPPTPADLLDAIEYVSVYMSDDMDCMQEALTVEWLIEQRLMPDPSEFGDVYRIHLCSYKRTGMIILNGWICEDNTQ